MIGESSKSILTKKMKTTQDNALWFDETLAGLGLDKVFLWTFDRRLECRNYAGFYPEKVIRLILLTPIQTFAKMYPSFFFKIMKMGFHLTRENVENYIGRGSFSCSILSMKSPEGAVLSPDRVRKVLAGKII